MEQKTRITAEDNKQEITITRDFDLPLSLLFKAHTEAELIEQWMNTRVIKFDSKKHGSWEIETMHPQGQVAFKANGVFHNIISDQKIVRTFEMEGAPFGVQLEVYDFEPLNDNQSRLTAHFIYESVEKRDQLLKLPFAQGLNMAHNRMQQILTKLK